LIEYVSSKKRLAKSWRLDECGGPRALRLDDSVDEAVAL
jgi:hypothetical protein